jgi:uncharacterized protein (TIGR02284 family)
MGMVLLSIQKILFMETNERVNEVLNDLIRINHDRVEGYEKAIKELPAADIDLKSLFKRYASESRGFANTLMAQVTANGGNPDTATTISGKIYRVWMELKTAMSNKERESLLSSCEFGEDAAQRAYTQALEADVQIPANIRDIIASQKLTLKSAHDEVRHYRDLETTEK